MVGEEHLASTVGSGEARVLSSPWVLALGERAACAALLPHVSGTNTSVGTAASLHHLKATPLGLAVVAVAVVSAVDGRTVTLDVEVRDTVELCATIKHTRVILDRERFESRAAEKRAAIGQ